MKNRGNIILGCMLFCLLLLSSAQAQNLWSDVQLSKHSVYVGEPVEVTVSVYTSTWFTEGVDPGNVKVEGAYTVFFRNVSTSKTVNGKTISGVDMIFNVFPYGDDNITFPQLEIEVESPADGDYKGKTHIVKTKPRDIKVMPIPPGFAANEWLVTNSLSVSQRWSGNLKNVKVGDVLTRTITRNVSNTVSQLIPGVAWDSVSGVSQYPYRSNVESHRSKTAISATRTETMRYLFEKEGEIVLPEMVFSWWNPVHQKVYKRTLPAIAVNVQPNPDLGMLASIKDSLAAQVAAVEKVDEPEPPFTILGMSLKKFVAFSCSILLLVIAFVLLVRWAVRYRKTYLLKYHNSELYYFRKLKRAVHRNDRILLLERIYNWIDSMKLPEPTLRYFAHSYGSEVLQKEAELFETELANGINLLKISSRELAKARRNYLAREGSLEKDTFWINP